MPSAFIAALRAHQPTTPPLSTRQRWAYIPYDQLSDKLGALAQAAPAELGIILIESAWRPAQRPYHKQKLALILANQRRFAIEQAARGVAVRYITTDASYHDALAPLAREQAALGRPIEVMRPAERELRALLAPLITAGLLVEAPHDGWLTTPADFIESQGGKTPWRMDAFYRHLRKRTGILMERGKPLGGKYSHDAENRLRWDGEPPAPEPRALSQTPSRARWASSWRAGLRTTPARWIWARCRPRRRTRSGCGGSRWRSVCRGLDLMKTRCPRDRARCSTRARRR